MKLWLISQNHNMDYDTYDSAVIACETEQEAKSWPVGDTGTFGSWALPEFVSVKYIGEAAPGTERGEICSSYNAG